MKITIQKKIILVIKNLHIELWLFKDGQSEKFEVMVLRTQYPFVFLQKAKNKPDFNISCSLINIVKT